MALIGHTACTERECGAADIPVYRTAGGKVYAACHRCEMTQQPKPGSAAHQRLLARMVPVAADDPAAPPADPAPDPGKLPERVKRAAGGAFNLGAL